jgi:valyl-tRNA synthetase
MLGYGGVISALALYTEETERWGTPIYYVVGVDCRNIVVEKNAVVVDIANGQQLPYAVAENKIRTYQFNFKNTKITLILVGNRLPENEFEIEQDFLDYWFSA